MGLEIRKKNENGERWYPVSIQTLDSLLAKGIESGKGYEHTYALRRNIAYNLQYIEFQIKLIYDIQLSSVIYTQTIKSVLLVGCSVIESILHYVLIANGIHSTTEWREKITFKGNQKKLNGEDVRVDTVIYSKLDEPILKHMTFDAMIKCAKSKNVFGKDLLIYEKLNELRALRNKVHLQVINNPTDTDWNSFSQSDLSDISVVLYGILCSELFALNDRQKSYFDYLRQDVAA
ncbi:TPA: hypothetical protein RUZ04_003738 [Vibrio cholerae]|uniref:hypothetical protein n=1 Tax=Vibrio cholerae TaxID=666 RepID=UPI0028DACA66|nr:hypothetical protein [Vibrio cholerae]